MSERYISPKNKAIRTFWASGLVGGGLFLGTYLTGQHYVNQHDGEPATTQAGTPSVRSQLEAGFGDAEVVEIVLTAAALTISAGSALERGALPRLQHNYKQLTSSENRQPKPTDLTMPNESLYVHDANDSELVKDNNRRVLAGNISLLGDEIIFSGRGDIREIAPLLDTGTKPDCSYEEASRVAAQLQEKFNDQQES